MPDDLILEGSDQPAPLKPADGLQEEVRIIYCWDRRRWMWSDIHPPCQCHIRRYLHRH